MSKQKPIADELMLPQFAAPAAVTSPGAQPAERAPIDFYKPTLREQFQVHTAILKLRELNAIIESDEFTQMVWRTSNEARWQWVTLLKPAAEFYTELEKTTVEPREERKCAPTHSSQGAAAVIQ